MRPAVLAVSLLVLAGIAFGVYRLTQTRDRVAEPTNDREAVRQTVTQFIESSRRGDTASASNLFTNLAQEQLRKGKGQLDAGPLSFRPGVTHEVGEAVVNGDTADVPLVMREAGQDNRVTVKLRRQENEWRIYAITALFFPDDPESEMTIDFENPQKFGEQFFGKDLESVGKDWTKGFEDAFNNGFEDSFKADAKPDDLANEALASIDRATFEAGWKLDLDVKDRPAGELLKELADAMDVKLESTPAQARALARPITLQLLGRSRRELVEEVCRRVGLYPVWGQRLVAGGKATVKMELRPTPRQYPVAFAGPFVVEVESLAEYVPHATGLVTLRVNASGLDPQVTRMMGTGTTRNAVAVKSVTDTLGRDLADAPTGLVLKSGLASSYGYDRTLELPLKNLLRDVTAVKTLKGVVHVPLPSKVESLRFESPAVGAVVKSGTTEVKLLGFTKSQMVVKDKSYPNAKLRVEYKGVNPERVRALAYDSQKKLLPVSGNSWSGSDAGGTAEFSVQGEPVVVVFKVITSVDYVEYEFAFNELPLTEAAGMPEKVVPVTFAGHDAPLTVEFVRITATQFPAKAQYRLVNHSDKDVRLVDLKLTYLDAAGRESKGWPSVTYSGPTPPPQNHKGPVIVVGKKGTSVVEMDAPFLPDNAKTIRVGVNKVIFTDATAWASAPLEK